MSGGWVNPVGSVGGRGLRQELFISYCQKDRAFLEQFWVHLSPLEEDYGLRRWDDSRIQPGDIWLMEIEQALERAQVALLLVSPHFLASDFIRRKELPKLFEAANKDGVKILWLPIRPCSWKRYPQIEQYQSVGSINPTLAEMGEVERDREMVRITDRIHDLFEQIGKERLAAQEAAKAEAMESRQEEELVLAEQEAKRQAEETARNERSRAEIEILAEEERWKSEAERLVREKEELERQLAEYKAKRQGDETAQNETMKAENVARAETERQPAKVEATEAKKNRKKQVFDEMERHIFVWEKGDVLPETIVGIDLGTKSSSIATLENGIPCVIANQEGSNSIPSIVAFSKNGDILVGGSAKLQSIANYENTFSSVTRLLGRTFKEIETDYLSFNVKNSSGEAILVCPAIEDCLSFDEILSLVLRNMVNFASAYLHRPITKVVVAVPSGFNYCQRQAIRNAGKIAGLDVLRLIDSSSAAALMYGIEVRGTQHFLVFDLGGGTFDVSVLVVGDGVFEVLSTNGDTHLGGDDFDKVIVDYLADAFKANEGIDLRADKQDLQRLTEAAEKAKIELSSATQSEINLPFITARPEGPKHLDLTLTRAKFEELASKLIDRCRVPVEQALKDAKLSASELDEVVMVGGSTRIPAVQELVKRITGKDPNQTVNPDEVVAVGAAIQGGVLAGDVKDILLLDVTPLSLGVETLGGVMTKMISRNTTIPTKKTEVFSTAFDGQSSIRIHVIQGESEIARDNKSLTTFCLDGISPAPKGVPQIEVTFDIDMNNILSVTAKDKSSGLEQVISVTCTSDSRQKPDGIYSLSTNSTAIVKLASEAEKLFNHLKHP